MGLTRRGFLAGAGAVAVVATLPKVADAEQSVNTILARVTQSVEIDGTGTTNVSAELNAFLNSVPPGSEVILPAGARFRCDQTILLDGRSDLTIVGNGAVIFTDDPTGNDSTLEAPDGWARVRSHVELKGCSNITITGLVVRGANPFAGTAKEAYVGALEGQHGFDVGSSTGVVLRDCTVTDVYGDFLYFGKRADGVLVEGFRGERSGRQGVAITNASNITVRDSLISDVRRTMVDFEPNVPGDFIDTVLFERVTFGPRRLAWMSAGSDGPVGNVTVRDCVMNCAANLIVSFRTIRRHNWTLEGNRSTVIVGNPLGNAWRFAYVDGVTVRNNDIMLQPGRDMYLVGVRGCTGVDVSGNTYPGGIGELTEF